MIDFPGINEKRALIKKGRLKRVVLSVTAMFVLWGCSPATICSRGGLEYEGACMRAEDRLSEYSRKVTVYFMKKDQPMPKDFDGERYIRIVEEVIPDQFQVHALRDNFKVLARPLGRGFSVMLCSPDGNSKLFEDFNCTFEKVDLVRWDKKGPYPCEFEKDPERFCTTALTEKK